MESRQEGRYSMIEKIGIDRILLKDLDMNFADVSYLKANGHTVIQDDSFNGRELINKATGEIEVVDYIKMCRKQDETLLFNSLKIGTRNIANIKNIDYEHLDINLPRVLSPSRTNENNINNTKDLNESVTITEKVIEDMGFGEVDLMKCEVKEIELNVNVELEHEFKEYKEVFEYIRTLLPMRLKKKTNCNHEPRNNYTGFQVNNNSMGLKFYNKKLHKEKESKDTDESEPMGELLRIEYSFFNENKIESLFNSNKFSEVVKEDFSLIDRVFRKLIQGDLLKNVYRDIENQIKFTVKKIKEYQDIKGISPIDNYLKNHQQELFDIEIVLSALRQTEITNNYSRRAKETIRSAGDIEGKRLFGNIDKLNEILGALGVEKIEMDMTKGVKKEVEKHY